MPAKEQRISGKGKDIKNNWEKLSETRLKRKI